MEQRPLRLGDIVDDYCPRERRITNHAVVAMSGEAIHHTRCAACDGEHPYKHAKAPLKRKKDENGALYDEVLAGVLKPKPVVVDAAPVEPVVVDASASAPAPEIVAIDIPAVAAAVVMAGAAESAVASVEPEPEPVGAAWGHRPLIRAQLPRIEGQAPAIPRPLPEFTIRQQGSRGQGNPHQTNGSRRGQGGGQNHHQGNGNGQSRGGRDQGGRSQGRSRHSR